MSKSHSFSIFLLKENFSDEKALKAHHDLKQQNLSTLPSAKFYLMDIQPKEPWWKNYLGISDDLKQGLKGGILFLSVENRMFALTFGNVQHKLTPESYEYDFGVITTLNSIEPSALKSTDVLQPESAVRKRIQTPKESDLTFFDFDQDSTIIKRLTGKVQKQYRSLFSNTSGADSLRVTTKKQPEELEDFCKELLNIYSKDYYKKTFPNLHNIRPVKDPNKLTYLDEKLVAELKLESKDIILTIPDIVDSTRSSGIKFSESKNAKKFESIELSSFYEYLGTKISQLDETKIKKEHFWCVDDNDNPCTQSFSVYKSLIFEFEDSNGCYHFCDGNWYQVDKKYQLNLTNYLDTTFEIGSLPEFEHKDEGEYNKAIPEVLKNYICLDKTNIAPDNETAVEPCDLFSVSENIACYTHVKIGSRSSTLSHLFNQGVNSISLLNGESESLNKLKTLFEGHPDEVNFKKAVDSKKSKVIYAIISKKDPSKKSKILPLFSRISLKRAIQSLKAMNVQYSVVIIEDKSKTSDKSKNVFQVLEEDKNE